MVDESPPADISPEFSHVALGALDEVHSFARSLARHEADAEDLVQETYLRAFRSWRTFLPGSDVRRWLFAICRNVFLRSRAREQRYSPLEDGEGETLKAVEQHAAWLREGAEVGLQNLDLGPAVERALEALQEPFRSVVALVDLGDHSYNDASAILGVPVGTVRSRLFRGRRILQEQLMAFARDAGLPGIRHD
jgi:RNA polymerase sigma-70 factor (ECF subfamily)